MSVLLPAPRRRPRPSPVPSRLPGPNGRLSLQATLIRPAAAAPAGSTHAAVALRFAALAALLVAAVVLAVRLGAVPLTLREIADALAGEGDATTVAIVRQLRLPRALQAAAVGAALGLSGAAFQALLRNALAEPYILGVSSGAAVGAVGTLVLGVGAAAAWALPAGAFAGALVAVLLVFRIAAGVGPGLDTRVLLLAGVVVAAFFNAAILLLLTFADQETYRSAMFWMMGSHANATWPGVAGAAAYLAAGAVVLLALARPLNLLAVGEETAAYLGAPVERTKRLAFAAASLLAAGAVAVSGVIGFVGLVVPHVARMWVGAGHRALLPTAACLGAAVMLAVDAGGRSVSALALPPGAITSLLGAPFFLWLLRRTRPEVM